MLYNKYNHGSNKALGTKNQLFALEIIKNVYNTVRKLIMFSIRITAIGLNEFYTFYFISLKDILKSHFYYKS